MNNFWKFVFKKYSRHFVFKNIRVHSCVFVYIRVKKYSRQFVF